MNIGIQYMLLLLIPFAYLNGNKTTGNSIVKKMKSINADSMILQYLVREPKLKAGNKKAVILLHGVCSNEQDIFSLTSQLPDDLLIIAPRGPVTLGTGSYAWYNVDFSTGKPVFNTQQEEESRVLIIRFLHEIERQYKVDDLYLGGFSQGAIMSYSVGLTNPKEVKGIIALSGRLLSEIKPSIVMNKSLQQLKVFVAHGTQDNTLPIQYAREAKLYLEKAGVQLSYHEYNTSHHLNGEIIKDLFAWLSY